MVSCKPLPIHAHEYLLLFHVFYGWRAVHTKHESFPIPFLLYHGFTPRRLPGEQSVRKLILHLMAFCDLRQ